MDERRDEVETVSCCQGYDDVTERRTRLDEFSEVLPARNSVGNREVDCEASTPQCDHVTKAKQYYADAVNPFGTLWAVAK